MKKKFDRKMTSSIYWKNKAKDFHAAALVLNEAIENNNSPQIQQRLGKGFNLHVATSHIFAYVAALSIELNLKACIIENRFKDELLKISSENENKIISEDEVNFDLDKNFCTHDLYELSKKARLCLPNTKIGDLLKILTQIIGWDSRYPIPKSEKVSADYSSLLERALFLPLPEGQKLRARKVDPEMILNLENYLKIWNITEMHYEKIKIK